jgi:hypothetical protein
MAKRNGQASQLPAIAGAPRAAKDTVDARGAEQPVSVLRTRATPLSDALRGPGIEPVPRIALTQHEACASLGCSEEFFVEHLRPHLRVVRRGRKRLFPVAELRRAVDEMAEYVI